MYKTLYHSRVNGLESAPPSNRRFISREKLVLGPKEIQQGSKTLQDFAPILAGRRRPRRARRVFFRNNTYLTTNFALDSYQLTRSAYWPWNQTLNACGRLCTSLSLPNSNCALLDFRSHQHLTNSGGLKEEAIHHLPTRWLCFATCLFLLRTKVTPTRNFFGVNEMNQLLKNRNEVISKKRHRRIRLFPRVWE